MGQRIDRVGLSWSLGVAALVIIAFAVGFLWMPGAQAGGAPSLWSALCRAAGITAASGAPAAPLGAAAIPSEVIWTPTTERLIVAGDAARGSALAATCAGCHGANGIGASDQFPDLAAQPAAALYKQLSDFHSGKRVSPIMQGFAATLTEQQMADLAAHFATLPAPAAGAGEPPRLVTVGDPARGLVACAACHGPMGHKLGAPELAGQKAAYIQAQLEAFAAGTRRNDINQQMRAIAHELRAEEVSALAQYYGGAAKPASPPQGAASAAQTSADTRH
ncbi:MAG TPA: c-type cytochrome [Burkholderiales bacterium]|nr:c-type cytochrome [Burkholderiales bacterium]